jgi:hypothetical protein
MSGAPLVKPYDANVWAFRSTLKCMVDVSACTLQLLSVGSGGTATPSIYEWDLRNMDGVPEFTYEFEDGDKIGIRSLALDPQRRHVYSGMNGAPGDIDCWDITTGAPPSLSMKTLFLCGRTGVVALANSECRSLCMSL